MYENFPFLWLLEWALLPLATFALLIPLYNGRRGARESKDATPIPAAAKEPRPWVEMTLRFQEIPQDVEMSELRSALTKEEGHEVVGMSWTPSTSGPERTATVCFAPSSSFIESIGPKRPIRNTRSTLTSVARTFDVQVDEEFMGMTPLYWPDHWDME